MPAAAPGAGWASGATSLLSGWPEPRPAHPTPAWGRLLGEVVPQATASATLPPRLSFLRQRWGAPQGARGQGGRPGHQSPPGSLPVGCPGPPSSLPVRSVRCASAVCHSRRRAGDGRRDRDWGRDGAHGGVPPAAPSPCARGTLGAGTVLGALRGGARGSSSSSWHLPLGAPRESRERPGVSQGGRRRPSGLRSVLPHGVTSWVPSPSPLLGKAGAALTRDSAAMCSLARHRQKPEARRERRRVASEHVASVRAG